MAMLLTAALLSATACSSLPPEPKSQNTGDLQPAPDAFPKKKVEAAGRLPEPTNVPDHLDGMTGEEMGELLGAPSFKRHDSPAEVWQYGGAACLLDVFLYNSEGGKTLTVAHSEARARDGNGITHKNCLTSLIRERRHAGSG